MSSDFAGQFSFRYSMYNRYSWSALNDEHYYNLQQSDSLHDALIKFGGRGEGKAQGAPVQIVDY